MKRNKLTAFILAIFLGGFGFNDFYTQRYVIGLLKLCFSWTPITWIIGFIQGINYILMSDEVFDKRYN